MNAKTYWGLLAGLGTGVVAGLLLAPKSGKETLTDISDATSTWRDSLKGQWDRMVAGLGGSQATVASELEEKRDELVHADFNNPENLPHRPRVEQA